MIGSRSPGPGPSLAATPLPRRHSDDDQRPRPHRGPAARGPARGPACCASAPAWPSHAQARDLQEPGQGRAGKGAGWDRTQIGARSAPGDRPWSHHPATAAASRGGRSAPACPCPGADRGGGRRAAGRHRPPQGGRDRPRAAAPGTARTGLQRSGACGHAGGRALAGARPRADLAGARPGHGLATARGGIEHPWVGRTWLAHPWGGTAVPATWTTTRA
jgi:hypothetical protein